MSRPLRLLVAAVGVALLVVWISSRAQWTARASRPEVALEPLKVTSPEPAREEPAPSGVASPRGELRGQVVRADDGKPIGGALVFWKRQGRDAVPASAIRRSDDSGEFSIPRLESKELIVRAEGYRPWFGPAEGDTKLIVALREGERVTGLVLDDLGQPVPGVRVVAHRPGRRLLWPITSRGVSASKDADAGTSVTDDRGAFSVAGLSSGAEYELIAHKPQWSSGVFHDGGQRVTAPSQGMKIVIRPVATLHIVPVDATTGERLVTTRFSIDPPPGILPAHMQQDFLGSASAFRDCFDRGYARGVALDFARNGENAGSSIKIEFGALGYRSATFTVPLKFGKRAELQCRLERDGSPLRPVTLRAEFAGGREFSGLLGVFITTSDSDSDRRTGFRVVQFERGLAEKTLMLPEGDHSVRAEGVGVREFFWLPAAEPARCKVTAAANGITLRLQGNPIDFTVVDDAGAPVRCFDVAVYREGAIPASPMLSWDAGFEIAEDVSPFRIWIPAGRHVLRVNRLGSGRTDTLVDCSGDGEPIHAIIRLKPNEAFDLKATRRRLVGR